MLESNTSIRKDTYKITKQFAYLFFVLSLISTPINISFFNILRPSDFFILTSFIIFLCGNPKINSIYFLTFSIFYGALILSSNISFFHNDNIRFSGLVFFYKYFLIFLIPWIILDLVDNKNRLKSIVSILYLIYISLIIWVFIYYILRTNGIIEGSRRVAYPFSNYHISDAHVLSSYTGFTFIAYQEYIRRVLNHKKIHSLIICIMTSLALFLNGSKTGILVLFIYFFIIVYRFLKGLNKNNLKLIILATILIALIPLAYNTYKFSFLEGDRLEEMEQLVSRPLNYNFSNASFTNRFSNFFLAVNEISTNVFIIGSGPIHSENKWYDGGLSIILAHGGIIGLLSLSIFCYLIIKKAKSLAKSSYSKELYKIVSLLLFIYLLLCIITEHFLLTRNLLPVSTLLSIIFVDLKHNFFGFQFIRSKKTE